VKNVKDYLDEQVAARNHHDELSAERPDPLMIARRSMDQHHALTCALFAYGSAKAIVAFLASLEADLLDVEDAISRQKLAGKYYRFQSSEDIIQWFCTLRRLKASGGAEKAFKEGYSSNDVIGGVSALITLLYDLNPYRSKGYEFLIGKPVVKLEKASAMKRWMMYLRWMVREDSLDMGLWKGVNTYDLIMPLDTHTFNISYQLGLLKRTQCDMRAAIELTEKLKEFDPYDPLKYDFALYRIGQEKLL
jgi:uncharacterized protein (TIGR02757 family)